jgi:hypothetical protein
MLMTVTNPSAVLTLNDFDVYQGYTGGPTVNAIGGSRKYPLPYPFSHVILTPSGGSLPSKQLAVHPRDWTKGGPVPFWTTLEPAEEWNQVVQSGLVTVTFAAETGRRDVEELFTAAV